jgi:hypothetical protein
MTSSKYCCRATGSGIMSSLQTHERNSKDMTTTLSRLKDRFANRGKAPTPQVPSQGPVAAPPTAPAVSDIATPLVPQTAAATAPVELWKGAFPPIGEVGCATAQYFDNGPNKESEKKSRYTIKLRGFLKDKTVNQYNPDSEHVIQLIADPKRFLKWATDKNNSGDMNSETLARYKAAYDRAIELFNDAGTEWARLGHFVSPPGKHYFIGQFALVHMSQDGELTATVFIGREKIVFDKWSVARGKPKLHSPYDPDNMIRKVKSKNDNA